MNRPNAISVRFEVFKILKDTPTHGYNLYLLLSQKGLVKHPSELYKILRTLKTKGLLHEDFRDSGQGPQKKILSLTPMGLEEYYSQITESLEILTDLLAEARIAIFKNLLADFLRKNGIDFNKSEKKGVFFDFGQLFPPFQREFLLKLVVPIQTKNLVYLRMVGDSLNDLLTLLKKIAVNTTILDENLSFKPQSMDFIFLVGMEGGELLKERVRRYVPLLKPEGGLIIIRLGKKAEGGRWRKGGEQPLPVFGTILREFVQTFPKKFRQRFINQVSSPDELEAGTGGSIQKVSNSETMIVLQENFSQVQFHDEIPLFSIFFARNSKSTKP